MQRSDREHDEQTDRDGGEEDHEREHEDHQGLRRRRDPAHLADRVDWRAATVNE